MLQRIVDRIEDSGRSFRERMFILMNVIAVMGQFAILLGNIVSGENIMEIILLGSAIFFLTVITSLAVYFHKIHLGAVLISLATALVMLPGTFLFGGGLHGGSSVWVVFAYLYIGLLLEGSGRIIMFVVVSVVTVAEYAFDYSHPQLAAEHGPDLFYVNSLISVIVVGLLIYVMVWFQNRLFMEENARAREAIHEVEELNRAQNRFFSSMSHEIRTPINTILGLNELILRDDTVSDRIAADARNIEGAGKMLLSIINDILDMSKIESGKMDIVPVPYRFSELLTDIVNMIWSRATEKGLAFHVDVDPDVPAELYGDEVRIKQILINLLNNAVKYTPEGSVALHVESERRSENVVVLSMVVTDTGSGIKKEALPYLFDAFKRVDEAKNRKIEGTGLGLAIVKQLVELMDGEITVDSVYTQGSTFAVRLAQEIVSPETVGRIGVVGDGGVRKGEKYSPSFEAPDTRILIVDDNELNLSVECALLEMTKVAIDTAASGEEALSCTLEHYYDVILMDHIMPGMDGIECLHQLKRQTGGLNVHTPVIVLTANVGSEEQGLYRNSGFDDYLTKPVSGAQLEEALLKFLPKERVFRRLETDQELGGIFNTSDYIRRVPVAVTTSSIADLPYGLASRLGIGIIPFIIHTEGGSFMDGSETVSGEVIDYMAKRGKKARSEPPPTSAFEEFFADALKRANHVIHISLSSGAGREYERARAAAQMFSSVTVIDSGALSSSVGMLALAAYQMTRRNDSAERIVLQLEELKKRVSCSFVASSTEFMLSMGNITECVHQISNALLLRPALRMKNGRLGIAHIYAGHRKAAWMKYIAQTLAPSVRVQDDVAFVTYVGMEEKDLKMIEEELARRSRFRRVIFKQASATISLNVGPGAFGILFFNEGEDNYHIGRLIDGQYQRIQDLTDGEEEDRQDRGTGQMGKKAAAPAAPATSIANAASDPAKEAVDDFPAIPGLDIAAGLKNCGSKKGYLTALELFYEAADGKQAELVDFYNKKDWEAYAIKAHALKSSARIIGAGTLAQEAEALEMAGKAGDVGYISANHARMISAYAATEEILRPYCDEEKEDNDSRPIADEALIGIAFDAIRDAVADLDIDTIEDAIAEISEYALPPEAEEILSKVKRALDEFDYEGILAALP